MDYHGHQALRVGAIELKVADLGRAESFYRDALGFRVARVDDGSAVVSADGVTPLVTLRHAPGAKPRGRTAGLFHVAFLLPSRTALGGFLRRAIDTQLPIQGAADHRVSEAIYLQDPDDHGIEIYADTADSGWRNEAGELDMGTDPFDYSGVYYAAEEADGIPAGTTLGHLHLAVRDLEKSLSFYRDVVGFAVTADGYPGARFLSSSGYHHHLALNVWERVLPRVEGRAGLAAATVFFPACEAAAAAAGRARAAGCPEASDDRGTAFLDPDGTLVRFTVR
ncbi:MAG: VOC family protein [Candidatus Izemoplasmatales bacterium]